MKLSATKNVNVQMVHGLSAIITGVDDKSETVVQFLRLGYRARLLKKFTEQFFITALCNIVYVLFGNDEYMCWRLRIDIAESEPIVLFLDDFCWNLFIDDFAE
jgi:hypothetical protein